MTAIGAAGPRTLMSARYWLLLEKSETPGSRRASTVTKTRPPSLITTTASFRITSSWAVVISSCSGRRTIFGVGRIDGITRSADTKIHRRCPECRSTDIRERSTKVPRWKCGKCAHEFSDPEETIVEVQSFVASIVDFTRLNSPPAVQDVKRCAAEGAGTRSQLSMLELDPKKVQTLLEGIALSPSSRSAAGEADSQWTGYFRLPNQFGHSNISLTKTGR
jgi:ribosomal protein L37AE/L43A